MNGATIPIPKNTALSKRQQQIMAFVSEHESTGNKDIAGRFGLSHATVTLIPS